MIRGSIACGDAVEPMIDDEVFIEGYLLTSRHRSRDRRLRAKLLKQTAGNNLTCDICDFAPPLFERSLRESFFEGHHIRPLSEAEGTTSTRVADMSLLCACCHRFIHKIIAANKSWFSIEEARIALREVD